MFISSQIFFSLNRYYILFLKGKFIFFVFFYRVLHKFPQEFKKRALKSNCFYSDYYIDTVQILVHWFNPPFFTAENIHVKGNMSKYCSLTPQVYKNSTVFNPKYFHHSIGRISNYLLELKLSSWHSCTTREYHIVQVKLERLGSNLYLVSPDINLLYSAQLHIFIVY